MSRSNFENEVGIMIFDGEKNDFCQWSQDRENNYETSCEHIFCIIEGTPTENEMRFCPYCGKEILQELIDEVIDDRHRTNGCAKMTDQKTHHASVASLLTAKLDAVAYMLYLETWLQVNESISDLENELLQRLYEKWITGWLPALNEAHCGDCTKVAATCVRCSVERLYEDARRILMTPNGGIHGSSRSDDSAEMEG